MADTIIIGDTRKAGEAGPAGDQRPAGQPGPAGDPRPAGQANYTPSKTTGKDSEPDQSNIG